MSQTIAFEQSCQEFFPFVFSRIPLIECAKFFHFSKLDDCAVHFSLREWKEIGSLGVATYWETFWWFLERSKKGLTTIVGFK
jgi:hypothetical protein